MRLVRNSISADKRKVNSKLTFKVGESAELCADRPSEARIPKPYSSQLLSVEQLNGDRSLERVVFENKHSHLFQPSYFAGNAAT